ncbi:hypothetical protein [Antribacter gilvus]|uniref:hypothetical protein n=1 Tax=Antribacter gilvus TaxID=2304675 RepID=UPI000F76BC72|nr:hypothetical protein [Antribacter gilvus]
MEPFVFFVLVLLLVAGGWYLAGRLRGNRRGQDIERWAEDNGWAHSATDPALMGRWTGDPFARGTGGAVSDVLRGGVDGYPMVSFTYSWRPASRSGEARRVGRIGQVHVVAIDALPGQPVLELSPEGFRDKVSKLFGGQDVQIDNPAFDGQWRVRASDEVFARRALDARLTSLVMLPDFHGARLRVEGPSVLLWKYGRTDPTSLAERTQRVADVARIVLPLEKGAPRFESGGSIPGFGIPTI